jgi:hypothetical protein
LEASLPLNKLIRRFDPKHDDLQGPVDQVAAVGPRQVGLMVE